MECKNCGSPDSTTCGCPSLDLLGFLSDFRVANAPAPEPVSPSRAAWTKPAPAADEVEPEEVYYSEPAPTADPGEALPAERYEAYQPPADEIPAWPPPPPVGAPDYWPPPSARPAPPYALPVATPRVGRGPNWAVVSAVLGAVILLGAGLGLYRMRAAARPVADLPPAQILQKSLSAASQAATAHLSQSTQDQGHPETDSAEISPQGGTIDSVVAGRRGSLVSVDGTMYMKADSWILGQFGLPSSVASRYGGTWLSMPTTIDGIKQAAEELETPFLVGDLLSLAGPITKVGSSHPGVVTLRGSIPANDLTKSGNGAGDVATLVVSAESPYYPVSISFSDPQNGPTTMTFSGWGHPVDLTPPPNATPIGAVIGSAA